MNKLILTTLISFTFFGLSAQKVMSPEALVQLNKVSGKGLTKDGENLIYSVFKYDLGTDKKTNKTYQVPIIGGESKLVTDISPLLKEKSVSPDGNYKIITSEVKIKNITGQDFYTDVPNSDVKIYDQLNYRHWDT